MIDSFCQISEGGMIRLESLLELKFINSSISSSNFSIRAFRAYPLVEIRRTVPCRAIRGSSISVSSIIPPSTRHPIPRPPPRLGHRPREVHPGPDSRPWSDVNTYIYIYIYIYIHICTYIYIYIYNRHLGLINAPPLILYFPPNDLFHYSFTIKKGQTYTKLWPRPHESGGRYQLFILGVILGIIHFLSKRDPPKSDQLYI